MQANPVPVGVAYSEWRTMSPDFAQSAQAFINSPPGQLAAGCTLAGLIWKFFQTVESVLKDTTKLEIADWLLGVRLLGPDAASWPQTFTKIFDRVFGEKHLSLKCFARSCLASFCTFSLVLLLDLTIYDPGFLYEIRRTLSREGFLLGLLGGVCWFACCVVATFIPDYLMLLKTRFTLHLMAKSQNSILWILLLIADTIGTLIASLYFVGTVLAGAFIIGLDSVRGNSLGEAISGVGPLLFLRIFQHHRYGRNYFIPFLYASLFSSIWLWLYVGAGFLLKAARRIDVGFNWFSRKFDIEHKPLQSIGLVSGILMAGVYWVIIACVEAYERL